MSATPAPGKERSLLELALQFLARGWSMVPSTGAEKKPCVKWKPFQTKLPTADQVREWHAKLHPERWGPVTGALSRLVVVDFDGEQGRIWLDTFALNPHVQTGSGGFHVYFRHPGWYVPTLNAKTSKQTWPWPGVDIRGDGGYAVLLGRNQNGPYKILREIEPESFDLLPEDLREFLRNNGPKAAAASKPAARGPVPITAGRVDAERLIRAALGNTSSGRNNAGFQLAVQARDNGYSEADSWIIREYQRRVPATNAKGDSERYTEQEAMASWREAFRRPAREPWAPPRSRSRHELPPVAPPPEQPEPPRREPPDLLEGLHRDFGNAQRLIRMYGEDLRYCHAFKKWLVWDGSRWRIDEKEQSRTLAQLTMVEFLRQAVKASSEQAQKFAKESLDSKRITNALREAQAALSIAPAELDAHPFLLNFLNGTVDVRTGRVLPHSREHFITKLVHYNYQPTARARVFQAFLARTMGVSPDASEGQLERAGRLIAYLQKAFGYSLTGITSEKAVFLLHGPGDNGKSTLLATFLELLDEYSVLLQIDTLMVRQESNNTQADLADLRGARFVMTSETEEGQRLAEGKLKRITQGMGRIKATRKYENPVEFDESHKLWIDANHLPQVRGTDNAIWNRLHPVPFEVTIPKAEQDKALREKLLAEAEGILAWAVKGAIEWHRQGLGKPPEIERAGAEWRAESDQVGRFIQDECIVGEYAGSLARQLYTAYHNWAAASGERAIAERDLCKQLIERGFKHTHTKRGARYGGIGLRAETSQDRIEG